jgi:D-alanyl-D-alanine carboxypeptidase
VRGRGLTVYTTILGAPNRAIRNGGLEALLSWGLSQFEVVPVVQPGASYARARLPYGRAPLGLVPTTGSLVAVRVGRPLRVRVVAATVARLPVRKGAVLGRIDVWDGGRLIGSRPLVASRAVSRPGFAWRVRWYAGRTLHHLVHLL